jgi:septum formation protein
MLNMLNGKIHTVITGYTIIETDTDKHISESVKTQVTFKRVSQKEIIAYVETGEPLNKAGSYAVQEHGGFLIKEIKGDYNNVVGLPLVSLLTSLQKVLRVPESANNIDMV